jgi:asparagine synthase (glutamine-hydrolysing)
MTVGNDLQEVPSSDILIAADADLHNRDELLEMLGDPSLGASSQDCDLIRAAYRKWGDACPERLLGEFSFAVWDRRLARLFCCTDHLGQRPFFYWTEGQRFAFSSDLLNLFPIPGIRRELNRERLAGIAFPSSAALGGQTFHKGIWSLPGGRSLTFSDAGLKVRQYWEPRVQPGLIPRGEDEAFAHLRQLLFEAVNCRIRGRRSVAVLLSGGLDSSALLCLAAALPDDTRNGRALTAISAVLPEGSGPVSRDEREFIEEFRAWPGIRREYVTPGRLGPFDEIDDPGFAVSSPLQPSVGYLSRAVNRAAVASGADVVLTGPGGELSATGYGSGYYLELAAGFHWRPLARELLSSGTDGLSPVRLLAREIRDGLTPHRGFTPPVLLRSDFADSLEPVPDRQHWRRPDQRNRLLRLLELKMRNGARRAYAEPPATQPFLDKRLIEFCLAAPGNMKVRDGYRRYLLRRALEGVMPEKLRWRTTKGIFSPDFARHYDAGIVRAREFVSAIRGNDPVKSVIDVERLRNLVNYEGSHGPTRSAALGLVPATIYAICFLRQFPEFRC